MEQLGAGEIHLWYVLPERAQSAAQLQAYAAILSDEERAQQQRFVFQRLRDDYGLARALVRTTLSRYAAVAPAAWRFSPNAYGRPEIDTPALPWPLRFNLSHTAGLMIIALALDREVGVDVEASDRRVDVLDLAETVFSPEEIRALHALPTALQRQRFFDLWTLKEAYIKARGMGLSLPLQEFTFHLDPPGSPVRISFSPALDDDPASWQFFRRQLSPRHPVALAARAPDEALTLTWRETVPLG